MGYKETIKRISTSIALRAETENACVSIACETLNEYKEWTVHRMLLAVQFIVNPRNSLDVVGRLGSRHPICESRKE